MAEHAVIHVNIACPRPGSGAAARSERHAALTRAAPPPGSTWRLAAPRLRRREERNAAAPAARAPAANPARRERRGPPARRRREVGAGAARERALGREGLGWWAASTRGVCVSQATRRWLRRVATCGRVGGAAKGGWPAPRRNSWTTPGGLWQATTSGVCLRCWPGPGVPASSFGMISVWPSAGDEQRRAPLSWPGSRRHSRRSAS